MAEEIQVQIRVSGQDTAQAGAKAVKELDASATETFAVLVGLGDAARRAGADLVGLGVAGESAAVRQKLLDAEVRKAETSVRALDRAFDLHEITLEEYKAGLNLTLPALESARAAQQAFAASLRAAEPALGAVNAAQKGNLATAQQLAYALSDLQYGIAGFMNNAQMLVSQSAGKGGIAGIFQDIASSIKGPGGVLLAFTAVSIGIEQLFKHWDSIAGLFETRNPFPEAATTSERFAGRLKDVNKELADLEKNQSLTNQQVDAYNKLQKEKEQLTKTASDAQAADRVEKSADADTRGRASAFSKEVIDPGLADDLRKRIREKYKALGDDALRDQLQPLDDEIAKLKASMPTAIRDDRGRVHNSAAIEEHQAKIDELTKKRNQISKDGPEAEANRMFAGLASGSGKAYSEYFNKFGYADESPNASADDRGVFNAAQAPVQATVDKGNAIAERTKKEIEAEAKRKYQAEYESMEADWNDAKAEAKREQDARNAAGARQGRSREAEVNRWSGEALTTLGDRAASTFGNAGPQGEAQALALVSERFREFLEKRGAEARDAIDAADVAAAEALQRFKASQVNRTARGPVPPPTVDQLTTQAQGVFGDEARTHIAQAQAMGGPAAADRAAGEAQQHIAGALMRDGTPRFEANQAASAAVGREIAELRQQLREAQMEGASYQNALMQVLAEAKANAAHQAQMNAHARAMVQGMRVQGFTGQPTFRR